MCVSTSTLIYLECAAGDLLHFIFRDRYVGWAVAMGRCVRGVGLSSNSYSKCLIYKAYTLQRYSDKL